MIVITGPGRERLSLAKPTPFAPIVPAGHFTNTTGAWRAALVTLSWTDAEHATIESFELLPPEYATWIAAAEAARHELVLRT